MSFLKYSINRPVQTRGKDLKVLHLISGGDTGGAKTHVLSLLRALSAADEVLLVCLAEGPMAREARETGIPCVVLSGGFPAEMRQVGALLREGRYELLHCHGSRANLTGALLRPGLAVPVLTTIHSDHRLDYLGRPAARLVYGTLDALALRHLDALVCVSDAMRETYRRRGFRAERLYTLYNGPDFQAPLSAANRGDWLARHGVTAAPGDVLAGAAARLDPVKDLPTLLRGFARAAAVRPELKLLLAGAGPEEQRLRALAAALGADGRVFFLGWVEDMEGFYASIDINVLSSLSETFPYALTDGARYGLPAVATRVGGIPALVEPGVNGFLFDPGDADGLSRALLSLAGSESLRRELGTALRRKAAEQFSLTAMVRRQREIYRELQKGRRGVVVSGAYGMGNVGDEAMLRVILAQIRETDRDAFVTVLSRTPRQTEAAFGVRAVHAFAPGQVRRALRGARLFLSGGGNLLQDVTSRRSLTYYLATLRLARRQGCRVLLYGCGAGPLSPAGLRRTAAALNRYADAAVLRDPESERLLRRAGVTGPELLCAAEPALELSPAPEAALDALYEKYGLGRADRLLLLCPRPWPGTEGLAACLTETAARARAEGLTPLFLALDSRQDGAMARQLAAQAACRVIADPLTPEEAAGLLGRAELVLSLRLHGLVLAAARGTPCAGVACDGRVPAFLAGIGQPWRELRGLSAGELCALLAEAREAAAAGTPLAERARRLAEKNSAARAALAKWMG